MPGQTTLLFVEDEYGWRSEIEQFIERQSGIEFREVVSVPSLEAILPKLQTVSGPVVILMDLRLEDNGRLSYSGYHWLLEDLRDFRRQHASTALFVISGQLNEGIKETLIRRGIPEDHIYDKGNWSEERDSFLEVLRATVSNMDEIALANIVSGASGDSIDPYLFHAHRVIERQVSHAYSEIEHPSQEPILLPMLVETKDESWDHANIPDLQVLGQIESIYSCLGSLATIVALEQDPDVLDVEGSRPTVHQDCHTSVPFVKADDVHQRLDERGDSALIGIIDSGIDVLHKAFRDSTGNRTRILSIWDQTDPTGPRPDGFDVGTEHSADDINRYIETKTVPKHLIPRSKDHGTHVASIAAGRPTSKFAGGVAPDARLVVVIPRMTTEPGRTPSLGYSLSHHLALEYIRDVAEEEGLPVVINVSQGMNAGAHDGTSSLEKGFDLITRNGKDPGIVVVKSAGNERGRRGHARLYMTGHSSESLRWNSEAVHLNSDLIELWFKPSDQFKFRLSDPAGEPTEWVSWSNPHAEGAFETGNEYELRYTRYDRDNGDSRLLIAISTGIAPTVSLGLWTLDIESGVIRTAGEIDAWVERTSTRPIHFVDHVSEEMTLSIPGTARYVISVGSVSASMPLRLAAYSSYGPTRDGRKKPDLAAPGEDIEAAKSGRRAATTRMSGTSMAAPHVTGAIALLLSYQHKQCVSSPELQQFNAPQVLASITQSALEYRGTWHRGLGWGVLDAEAFLREMGATTS